MVEKTWTDGEEMITMGESALTVQIDIETLGIEGETDVGTMTSTRAVLRKEGEAIHVYHPLLINQDNLEAIHAHQPLVNQDNSKARLHILNAPTKPYLLKKKSSKMNCFAFFWKKNYAHYSLLLNQHNFEARLHIPNAPKYPYLLKKRLPEMITSLHLSGTTSTPAPEPFATRVLVVEISKSLSTFSMTVLPRQMQ